MLEAVSELSCWPSGGLGTAWVLRKQKQRENEKQKSTVCVFGANQEGAN